MYNIVTGFFPEAKPKATWETNPRPLLVCGVARDDQTRMIFCRVAYGSSKNLDRARDTDLVIGNMSFLNTLGLKYPTRFAIHSGAQMAILPWISEFFHPWTGYRTPVLSRLDDDMQRVVGYTLSQLTDLPAF